jgi:hypothetical protein
MGQVTECIAFEHPKGLWSAVARKSGDYLAVAQSRAALARWATDHGCLLTEDREAIDPPPGGLIDVKD